MTSFRGKKLAIDASGWLHKSLWVTVEDLVDSNFAHDEQLYVDFFITRVTNLRRSGTEPVFVFDGKRHAMKSETQVTMPIVTLLTLPPVPLCVQHVCTCRHRQPLTLLPPSTHTHTHAAGQAQGLAARIHGAGACA